jgi:uncharacterized protein (TIGR02452 family)
MSRSKKLSEIYQDTVQFCEKNKRKFEKSVNTVYSFNLLNEGVSLGDKETIIEVQHKDTLTTALALREENLNPLILNMASERNPGGGVERGAAAQEESLFRRTNYCLNLDDEFYPLPFDHVIYSSNIAVIKDEKHRELNTFEYFGFLACPGLRNPGKLSLSLRSSLKKKISLIFQVALHHKHDSLVLGALGAGVFRTPCADMAEIFKEVVEEYKGCFTKIVFAVLGEPNYSIFKDIFDRN